MRWLTVIFAFGFIVACASEREVSAEIYGRACAARARCFPAQFAASYPGGEAQCTETGVMRSEGPFSACSHQDVDQCMRDIDAIPCSELATGIYLPRSCLSC